MGVRQAGGEKRAMESLRGSICKEVGPVEDPRKQLSDVSEKLPWLAQKGQSVGSETRGAERPGERLLYKSRGNVTSGRAPGGAGGGER